jgi:YegS/Rv2252/BmrU family lipid kinase
MRTCVIFNPVAKGDKAGRFRQRLDEIGSHATLKQTRAAGDARRLAGEAVLEGFDTIVAAGGDGTLNEVLNGIANAPDGLDRARLGVLPLGTVNVFARELGIPLDLNRAWQVLRAGKEMRIDLPKVEHQAGGRRQTTFFAQLAGAGLDARAIELVNWDLKKKIGPLAYVVAGLTALCRKCPPLEVSDGNRTEKAELVLIGNGQLYGGDYRVFSRADLRDGLLEVCVLPRVNWLILARCGPGLLFRRRLPASVTRTFRAALLTLSCPVTMPLEADGELLGHLPAKFSVEPGRLRVIVP